MWALRARNQAGIAGDVGIAGRPLNKNIIRDLLGCVLPVCYLLYSVLSILRLCLFVLTVKKQSKNK